MSAETQYVVKIMSPLSNNASFVRIHDPNMSVDGIFRETISSLRNSGKPLEAQQLEQLFKDHQIFANNKVVQKGDLFKDLERHTQDVGNQHVEIVELNLISSHSGGFFS